MVLRSKLVTYLKINKVYQVVPQVRVWTALLSWWVRFHKCKFIQKGSCFWQSTQLVFKPMAMRLPSVKPAVNYYRNDTRLMKRSVINQWGLYFSILRDMCVTETLSDLKQEVVMGCFQMSCHSLFTSCLTDNTGKQDFIVNKSFGKSWLFVFIYF